MKYFIITIDTEGDDLWHYKKGQVVKTENSLYIMRFQELCEKYGFKPVWLTNYEMACDQRYVDYIKPKAEQGLCEVGIHVHAWNNPPFYDLRGTCGGNPYLIEYPNDIMRAKFKTTYDIIKERFGLAPVSHRAGRWVMNDEYFRILKEFSINIDCSYTPTVSWEKTPGETVLGGNDYSNVISTSHKINGILEVPTTIRSTRNPSVVTFHTLRGMVKQLLYGKSIWLRPATSTLDEMKWLCRSISKEESTDYVMFMMHSSEMMPGGSPYFTNETGIEKMYKTIGEIYKYAKSLGYEGITLKEYNKSFKNV